MLWKNILTGALRSSDIPVDRAQLWVTLAGSIVILTGWIGVTISALRRHTARPAPITDAENRHRLRTTRSIHLPRRPAHRS